MMFTKSLRRVLIKLAPSVTIAMSLSACSGEVNKHDLEGCFTNNATQFRLNPNNELVYDGKNLASWRILQNEVGSYSLTIKPALILTNNGSKIGVDKSLDSGFAMITTNLPTLAIILPEEDSENFYGAFQKTKC